MERLIAFDDVLITPQFSTISSRQDVDLSQNFLGHKLDLPVISSNMDAVTGHVMARTMKEYGALGCLHRFWDIESNVEAYLKAQGNMVSVGLGEDEYVRACKLFVAGASTFIIDVAHGACDRVIEQAKRIRHTIGREGYIVAGNFATAQSLEMFLLRGGNIVDAVKCGVGGGSACSTRIVTGCGAPTLQSIIDCADIGIPIIADGGIRTTGDIAKSLAAGASVVMLGRMFAGCDETPTALETLNGPNGYGDYKMYRGSASLESYQAQQKRAKWRAPEGEAFLVKHTGPASQVLQLIEGGLRSALSYVGATNLKEFREKAVFSLVTSSGATESHPHGKQWK